MLISKREYDRFFHFFQKIFRYIIFSSKKLAFRILLISHFLLLVIDGYCQQEADIWYFGYHAGLDFSTNPPTILSDGQTETIEGVASICTPGGQLLFYTDGVSVWNHLHQIMPNGAGLFGDKSATQSSIIIPKINDPSRYYVFTVDQIGGAKGLNYSIVNMNLDNSNGDIEVKNVQLLTPVCEKITAVKHCNGSDIWVITHEWNSDAYYAYLVTNSGISNIPVISHIGTVLTGITAYTAGYLKASPDGKKLAIANQFLGAELFNFDNVTGILSNPVQLIQSSSVFNETYGVEFSASSKLLYINATDFYTSSSPYHNWVLQYDVSQPSGAAIISSMKIIYADTTPFAHHLVGALQMGPNNKIYMGMEGNFLGLSVIDFPDSVGSSCHFNFNQIQFAPPQSPRYGLPTFIQSYSYPVFTFSDVCTDQSINFYYQRPSNIIGLKWDFDDPLSGTNNISFVDSPSHFFTNQGLYNVSLIRFTACGSDTIRKRIQFGPGKLNLGNDTTLCGISSYLLNAEVVGNYSYLWQDGSTAKTFTATQSGIYWAEVKNNQTGCFKRDSIQIFFNSYPVFSLGNDTTFCEGQSVLLSTTLSQASYLWSTGATANSQVVTTPRTYWLDVTVGGCTKRDSINVMQKQTPIVHLGNDTVLCIGRTHLLDAQNAGAQYLWQNNSDLQTQLVNQSGIYWAEANLNGCKKRDTIVVSAGHKPQFSLGPDQILCPGISMLLSPGLSNVNYLWQDGSVNSSYPVTQTGLHYVDVANSCGITRDSINILKGSCNVYLPSGFTPNKDELNDIFRVKGIDLISEINFKIFDRAGQVVFMTKDKSAGWDGKYKGADLSSGTYVCLIIYKEINTTGTKMLKGTITLIR